MSSDGINSLKVSVFILSFFYFFISTICLVRLFLLCKRSKDFGYKKTFFLITSFFSIGRIIYLLLQVFKEQTINKTWFKIFGSLLSDIFILTFLLLTFALANSFYESKKILTTFLIVFVILRVPFKKSEFRILDDSSKTNYITSQEDTDDEDTEAFNTYF